MIRIRILLSGIALNLCLLRAQSASFVPDELLVQIRPGTEDDYFFRSFEITHGIAIAEYECLSEIAGMYRIRFNCSVCDLDFFLSAMYITKDVIAAQKNHFITIRETIPDDALFTDEWHLKNDGSTGGTVDADIDATDAWDITTGGLTTHADEIVVCVVEGGGVDITHEDLIDNIWHNALETDDGIDNDGNGYIDDLDGWNVADLNDDVGFGNHGTRVSGMIGAKGNNGIGISGVNWNVKLMIVKGQVAANEASVLAAYNYPLVMRKMYDESFGTEGAFVVATNSSWGIDNADNDDFPLWCAMYDTLGAFGILSIAATTNNDSNVDLVGDMPTTCTSDYLISATMTGSNDVRASSGYGPINVDLAAPGSGVKLTVPTNAYSNTGGTSFASPCVAGAVALAYSTPCADFINYSKFNPSLAALVMKDYILDYVDLLAALTGEVGTGGRLNVNNTINAILNDCDTNACIAPYYIHLENLTDTVAEIGWNGFSGNYVLYIQENTGPVIAIPMGSLTSFNFDTLKPCTNYSVYLQAICGTDSSILSYPLDFETDGCCYNPVLDLDLSSEDSLVISWPPILYGTQYDFRYRKTGTTTWTTLNDVTSPVELDGLEPCTSYDFEIYTLCDDSTHGWSVVQWFSTMGCGACAESDYCMISGGNDSQEWIDSIALNTFSNTTGANGGWYVSEEVITALTPTMTYNLTIVPGYAGFNFTENFNAWIDYDQSGTFEPAEIIANVSDNSAVTVPVTIPGTAEIGITKMRIGMSALSEPEVCHTDLFWGEFEDYCVYIGPQTGITEAESEIVVYPNPADHDIRVLSSEKIISIQIVSPEGRLIQSYTENTGSIDIRNFSAGLYLLHVQSPSGTSVFRFVKR